MWEYRSRRIFVSEFEVAFWETAGISGVMDTRATLPGTIQIQGKHDNTNGCKHILL